MVYILTVSHNRRATTVAFAEQLIKQSEQNFHLILVDDGSTDGTGDEVSNLLISHQLTLIRGNGKFYWGGGLHAGFQFLKHKRQLNPEDVVLICNDDIVFDSLFLEKGKSALERAGRDSLVHAVQVDTMLDSTHHGYHIDWKLGGYVITPAKTNINTLDTRALWLSLETFMALKGFYPRLLPHYCSDWEFTHRAYRRGYKLISDDSITIASDMHPKKKDQPQNVSSFSKAQEYYWKRKSPYDIYSIMVFALLSAPFPKNLGIFSNYAFKAMRIFSFVIYQDLRGGKISPE
ncbi:MAG: glycosyltransferase [Flavobacteriales bacterium]